MIEHDPYFIADPDAIETPAMVVFEQQLDANIADLCGLVGGGANLMAHVKTHKSEAIARKQLAAGIAGFKCATLQELELALDAGAPEAILAYPMVQSLKAERFGRIADAHGEARVYATAGDILHVEVLSRAAIGRDRPLLVMLDLDVGMHRTGASLAGAESVYAEIHKASGLQAAGIHAYDGHEHFQDPDGRAGAAHKHIDDLKALKSRLETGGMAVPRIVAGGSFSFPYYARTEGFHGSPGTVIYWDINGTTRMPDQPFRWAAMVLCQVVERRPEQQTITTDLGVKAIASDPPLASRARLLGHMDARLLLQNEEHGVFLWPGEDLPAVGDYLLAVPGHVCPTTIRYPGSFVIDAEGTVVDFYPHTARDRQ
ncbi:MAG TPA: alanine racemase [Candidatus Latescibacteria bacterium]|jgi:D-serine deaminase-like pyridoxal phosphate-dependent protein|nr:alanine racemase [Candidatus Latescibacterota bacterium]HJP33817.1 alanine racemase [Candidatus Latescibacterota bacterium]|tara:strand:+ start:118 stop:1230 length:1113 start_codon:yes stop_codon:yes gene_type:complete